MDETRVSDYIHYLPAIFQDSVFLGRFLLALEKTLSGLPEDASEDDHPLPSPNVNDQRWGQWGIEQVLDNIHRYFDPVDTPEDFLPWLANWVALTLRDDWSPEEKQRFIQRAVPLYKLRGTLTGLRQFLIIYLNPHIYDQDEQAEIVQIQVWDHPMQLGVASTINEDTVIGEPTPHHFRVKLVLTDPTYVDFTRKQDIARAIIEQEKPAHTTYELLVQFPTMQIGRYSYIGYDTMLNTGGIHDAAAYEGELFR